MTMVKYNRNYNRWVNNLNVDIKRKLAINGSFRVTSIIYKLGFSCRNIN